MGSRGLLSGAPDGSAQTASPRGWHTCPQRLLTHRVRGPADAGARWLCSWQVASRLTSSSAHGKASRTGQFGRHPSRVRCRGSLVAVKTIIVKMSETQPDLRTVSLVRLFFSFIAWPYSAEQVAPELLTFGWTAQQWASCAPGVLGSALTSTHQKAAAPDAESHQAGDERPPGPPSPRLPAPHSLPSLGPEFLALLRQ